MITRREVERMSQEDLQSFLNRNNIQEISVRDNVGTYRARGEECAQAVVVESSDGSRVEWIDVVFQIVCEVLKAAS